MSRSKLAWMVAIMMGFQSMLFSTTAAWFPALMVDRGIDPKIAGFYLMLNQFAQVPMTFIFPVIAGKMKAQRILVVIVSSFFLIGYSLLFTDYALMAMIFAGLGSGSAFSICMLFCSLRARTKEGSIALSGFGQSVGYLIASIGPFMMGYLHDITDSWTSGIILLFVMVVIFMITGIYAGSNRVVEDEQLS
ncbi:MFS transporter [Macrococcus brunensis]|uniref:MFS transporter n=1 Tax=Macrococcus brunensis TaxID=198483 RepID=UPI00268A6414